MRKSRRVVYAIIIMVVVLLLVSAIAGLYRPGDRPIGGAVERAKVETSEKSWPGQGVASEAEDVALHISPICEAQADVASLVGEVARGCVTAFARQPLCTPPLAFPPGDSPDQHIEALREEYAACPGVFEELVVDCTEYPCFAMVRRATLAAAPTGCDALDLLAEQMPDVADPSVEVAAGGPAWRDWVATTAVDPPADLELELRGRAPGRYRVLGDKLAAASSAGPDVDRASCQRDERALHELTGQDACRALRRLWGCDPPTADVSEEEYFEYEAFAQDVYEGLLDTCPNITPENSRLDCTGVPCLLLLDTDPALTHSEAFCKYPKLKWFTRSGSDPGLRAAFLFRTRSFDEEPEVSARFEKEKALRLNRLFESWDGSGAP